MREQPRLRPDTGVEIDSVFPILVRQVEIPMIVLISDHHLKRCRAPALAAGILDDPEEEVREASGGAKLVEVIVFDVPEDEGPFRITGDHVDDRLVIPGGDARRRIEGRVYLVELGTRLFLFLYMYGGVTGRPPLGAVFLEGLQQGLHDEDAFKVEGEIQAHLIRKGIEGVHR